jgi:hypothetical protein
MKEREHLEGIGVIADNIKMNDNEMDWACTDWIYERQNRTIDGLL